MKTFLLEQGLEEQSIELDPTAVVTEDSCVAEINRHPERRSTLFISHGFHLPRILFGCKKFGVRGIGVPAEHFGRSERIDLPWHQTFSIHYQRYHREALLTWLNIVGLYGPTLSRNR